MHESPTIEQATILAETRALRVRLGSALQHVPMRLGRDGIARPDPAARAIAERLAGSRTGSKPDGTCHQAANIAKNRTPPAGTAPVGHHASARLVPTGQPVPTGERKDPPHTPR